MKKNSKIYIAGHNGMVGSAILRKLKEKGFTSLIYKSSSDLDLTNQNKVISFFEKNKPEYVFLAAAKVGGIEANNVYKAQFIYENLMIQSNIIHSSYLFNVKKLLFLGSSCIYPKLSQQPILEDYLLSGKLEPTNKPYAIAKIAGVEMCKSYNIQYKTNFISLMPTNLYGTNDNYHPNDSHVFASLIRKCLVAKKNGYKNISLWGSGKPLREFLHVNDLASAALFLMQNYNENKIINVGSGDEISIKDLALKILKYLDFDCSIVFDKTKPDGTPRKLLDSSKIKKLGWKPKISINKGIKMTIEENLKVF